MLTSASRTFSTSDPSAGPPAPSCTACGPAPLAGNGTGCGCCRQAVAATSTPAAITEYRQWHLRMDDASVAGLRAAAPATQAYHLAAPSYRPNTSASAF